MVKNRQSFLSLPQLFIYLKTTNLLSSQTFLFKLNDFKLGFRLQLYPKAKPRLRSSLEPHKRSLRVPLLQNAYNWHRKERENESKMVKERDYSYFKGRNLVQIDTHLIFSRTPIAAKEFTEGLVPNKTIAYKNVVISALTELLDKLFSSTTWRCTNVCDRAGKHKPDPPSPPSKALISKPFFLVGEAVMINDISQSSPKIIFFLQELETIRSLLAWNTYMHPPLHGKP